MTNNAEATRAAVETAPLTDDMLAAIVGGAEPAMAMGNLCRQIGHNLGLAAAGSARHPDLQLDESISLVLAPCSGC